MRPLDWRSMGLGSLAGALGATALYAAAPAALPIGDRAAMEALIRDYILAHPEIIAEAVQRAETKAGAALVAAKRPELERGYPGAVAGNPYGDVTLVEFFDYACTYCRTTVTDIERLMAEDPKLRVVFRELPILSPESEAAARSSLSAAKAGTFLAFHRAMYARGRLAPEDVAAVERATGTPPPAQVDPNHDQELEKNVSLARALQLTGTPSFVVGDTILNGAVGYDRLKQAIADTRAARPA